MQGRAMYLGAVLDVRRYLGHDHVYFHSIMSPQPSPGLGSKAMLMITELADKHDVRLEGHVHPFGEPPPMNEDRLLMWYSKYGFEKQAYEHPENSEPGEMAWRIARHPRK
jgi:hypothetical protein